MKKLFSLLFMCFSVSSIAAVSVLERDVLLDSCPSSALKWSIKRFSGALPTEIEKVSKLEISPVFHQELGRQISNSLCTKAVLKVELLNDGHINGKGYLDIAKINDLDRMVLFDNGLKGLIPKGLVSLKKLRELNIS